MYLLNNTVIAIVGQQARKAGMKRSNIRETIAAVRNRFRRQNWRNPAREAPDDNRLPACKLARYTSIAGSGDRALSTIDINIGIK
jgi:hypothetical protein